MENQIEMKSTELNPDLRDIRLVIFDLDETFWSGTLSEGGVEIIDENIDIVISLAKRGIISSISSKNNFDSVKSKLEDVGVWDYFCFPQIDWKPKGELVKEIIEDFQLRPETVLFIDDNSSNLREVEFYNNGIHVYLPSVIPNLLDHVAFRGKNDECMGRLSQYKILEQKKIQRTKSSDNESFLRSCGIGVHIIPADMSNYERIYELINRTNQLNYTKIRLDENGIKGLFEKDYDNFLVEVNDNYGDYGFVGFVSYCSDSKKLVHFTFSCRTLNMGIPAYVYKHFNSPKIDIVGDVIESLEIDANWIKLIEEDVSEKLVNCSLQNHKSDDSISVLLKGGCDLEQMISYIDSKSIKFTKEFNYIGSNNMAMRGDHTVEIVNFINGTYKDILSKIDNFSIYFYDDQIFKTKIGGKYDCLIYSVLMDYTQSLYVSKKYSHLMVCDGDGNDVTNLDSISNLHFIQQKKGVDINILEMQNFANNFTYKGVISPDVFVANLQIIRNYVPDSIPIIFINGAEIDINSNQFISDSVIRHREMNLALDNFISSSYNCHLLDVRKFITNNHHLTKNIRHYSRSVYYDMSNELIGILSDLFSSNINKNNTISRYIGINFIDFIKRKISLYFGN